MSEASRAEEASIDIQQLTQQVVLCLYERKGTDIVVFDVDGQTSYCDRSRWAPVPLCYRRIRGSTRLT